MSGPSSASLVTPIILGDATTTSLPSSISTSGVGICFSGGGSRAMSAAMGQLQALEQMTSGSTSLLDQVTAMSTVSGGGWIGIPFTYLPATFTDAQFLGSYFDPGELTDTIIKASPTGWIGGQISSGFSIPDLAVHAIYLHAHGVPSHMLWQTLMGIHFLAPYGLFPATPANYGPTTLFSLDATILQADVTGPNAALVDVPAYLVAQVSGQNRPYLLSVCSMFVTLPDGGPDNSSVRLLAPVQSTPVLTGILPTPQGAVDANNQPVGGGAVASFAFNSAFTSLSGSTATISQSQQWSLMDIMGTSSAAFAAAIESQVKDWARSPERFAAALRLYKDSAAAKLAEAGHDAAEVAASLEGLAVAAETGGVDALKGRLGGLAILTGLVPTYDYWSPATPPTAATASEKFADGGSLDNTGVTSMLLYPDVTSIIAFVNSSTPMSQDKNGTVIVDKEVAALFGFQGYSDKTLSYAPFTSSDTSDLFRMNQVFSSDDFTAMLDGLWQSSGGNESNAPVFTQQLVTVANDWFGIPAGRSVTMLWMYLGMAQNWRNEITAERVKLSLDEEMLLHKFPHYSTLKTELSPTQVNFLANLTAWTMLQNSDAVTALFS
ncbi:MAG: hypothetical protein ABIO86_20600 [Sphingomonas sp.]